LTKKKISKDELKKVFGGIKSNILNELEGESTNSAAAAHLKYTVDFYGKRGTGQIDNDGSIGADGTVGIDTGAGS